MRPLGPDEASARTIRRVLMSRQYETCLLCVADAFTLRGVTVPLPPHEIGQEVDCRAYPEHFRPLPGPRLWAIVDMADVRGGRRHAGVILDRGLIVHAPEGRGTCSTPLRRLRSSVTAYWELVP